MKKHTYILLLLIICSLNSYAQEAKIDRAEKKYENFSFVKSSEVFLKVAESGYKSKSLFEQLGNSFYFNADYVNASKWYQELFNLEEKVAPVYLLRFSQSLRNTGKDTQAIEYYNKFLETLTTSNSKFSTGDYLERIQLNSGRYTVKSISVNTDGVDFGGAILKERKNRFYETYLVFSSTKDTGVIAKRKHSWNNLPFMELYKAKVNEKDGTLEEAIKLSGDINTKHHETSATFTSDGKTIYFTRGNSTVSSKKIKTQKLKIYRATLIDGEWTNIEDLSINSDEYSNAHPALSKDGTKLYFSSNRPGGLGLIDIYVVSISEDGTLGIPKNMGDLINTRGRDSFPFISGSNELYFSSDGHFGLGGYDVFYVDLNAKNPELLNIGEPINSSFDDLAYTINSKTKRGFISSNREGGSGNDDIYSFIETEPIKSFKCIVFGKVVDIQTKAPIASASVSVYDTNNTFIDTINTTNDGKYSIDLNCDTSYIVKVESDGYVPDNKIVETLANENELNFELEKEVEEVNIGTNLSSLLDIKQVFFDLDKFNIRPDAQVELEKVVVFMSLYPEVSIDIRSHTDSRSGDFYNLILSNNRAQSTRNYLIERGIDSARLTAKGYGETQLVNRCSNNINCTEEEHQENRRSEFVVVNK